ncbi:MAG: hypothetical protein O7F73_03640 [Gammaproteobacteria bacterium]|nr:hypothetical protein [Gammaproteobacteria bacterium]
MVWKSLLILMLMTAASWAQQTADSSVSTEGEQAASEEKPSVAEVDSELDPQPEETEGETSISPPDEYRASEQISDDLSVSFPVDI